MSGHEKIITLQPIINHSWIFILLEDCNLYNKQKIRRCLKIPDLLLVFNT